MYCNKCGTYLPDEADFCPSCGACIQRPAEVTSVRTTSHGKNSVVIGAIAAVTIVLVACIICFTVITQKKQDAQLAAAQVQTAEEQTDGQQDAAGAQTSDAEEDKTAEDAQSGNDAAVTNNYYYYGSTAASDNEYYTRSLSSGYLWPTDSQYLSSSDLRGFSRDTVAAIRNEIYARHGYAFTTARWQTYFAGKTWYDRDSTCTDSTIKARLSSIERANISTIVAYEESQGWR